MVGAGQAGGSGQRHGASRPGTGQKWFPSSTTGQSSQPPGGEGRPGEDAVAQRQGAEAGGCPPFCGRDGCTHPAAATLGLHTSPLCLPRSVPLRHGLGCHRPRGLTWGGSFLLRNFWRLLKLRSKNVSIIKTRRQPCLWSPGETNPIWYQEVWMQVLTPRLTHQPL